MQFASHEHQMSQVFLSNLSIDYGWEQDNLENLQESGAKQQTGNTQSSIKYASSSPDSKKQLMVITRQAAAFNFDQSLSMERECQKCQKFQQKIQSLNNQIVQLTNHNQWFKRQNDQILLNQQMLMDEQATKQADMKDLQIKLGQMELQLQKQQNSAQYEITSLKTKLIEYENRVLEREYDFQLIEQLKRQNAEIEESYKHKISELQVFIRQQEQYHQKAQLEQLQCSRKNSLASLSLQYKSQIAKEKSPPSQEQLQVSKFVECIVDMVANCTQKQKDAQKPTLQQCWKWLKNILEEYMHLKKQNQKEKLQHNQSKELITQKQYLFTDVERRNTKIRDISKRNQTTFEDKENQFINSNINISKQWN